MNVLISTLAFGSIYSLIAVCFIVDFKVKKYLNFTILSFVSFAPLVVSEKSVESPSLFGYIISILLAISIISLIVYAQDRILFRGLDQLSSLAKTVCSLSLFLIYYFLLDFVWSKRSGFGLPFNKKIYLLGSTEITFSELFAILAFVILSTAMYFLAFRTRYGKRFRSFSSDSSVAKAYGVSLEFVSVISAIFIAIFASAAGLFQNFKDAQSYSNSSFIGVSIVALSLLLVSKGLDLRVCLISAFSLAVIQALVSENLSSLNSAFKSVSSSIGFDTQITLGATFASIFVPLTFALILGILIPRKFVKGGTNA